LTSVLILLYIRALSACDDDDYDDDDDDDELYRPEASRGVDLG